MESPSEDEQKELSALLATYHTIMGSLSQSIIIRKCKKPSLDYFYTAIMHILDEAQARKVTFSKPVCAKLLDIIIMK